MRLFVSQLNSLETSVIIWTLAFILFALTLKGTREAIPSLVKSLLAPKVLGLFLTLGLWTWALVLILRADGFWQESMLKDTVWWFFGSATVLLTKGVTSEKRSDYLVRALRGTLAVTVAVKFVLGIFVVSLPWALIAVPISTFLACLALVANKNPEHQPVKKLANFLLGCIAFALAWASLRALYTNWSTFDHTAKVKDFILPVFLTVGIVPLVYLVSLLVLYEAEFRRLEVFLQNSHLKIKRVKWLTVRTCRLSLPSLEALDGDYHSKLQMLDDVCKVPKLIRRYTHPDPAYVITPAEIEILRVRLVRHRMQIGPMRWRLQVDWKNNGKVPVEAVFANISQFDSDGTELEPSTENWGIYYADDEAVKPGEIYNESGDEEYILIPWSGTTASAKVEITKVRAMVPRL